MDEKAAVIATETARHAALVAVDRDALDALFAEDLVHIHSNGLVHRKQEIIDYIVARRAFRAIDRGPLEVRITGDTAVMTGPMTNHAEVDGKPLTMVGMVTQVLRKEEGRWRFINFQMTLLK